MTDPYQGGIALGQMLFGKASPDAGLDTEYKVYRNASALENARIDQSMRVARDAFPDAIRAQPNLLPHQQQLLIATGGMAPGQPNVKQGVEGLGALLDLETRGQRATALQSGDAKTYNRLTALETDKPFQPTITQGGAYMANGADVMLGDEFIPTLPTMVQQQRADAAIQQGERRTDAAVAKAGRTGNSGGAKPKAPKEQKPSEYMLAEARKALAANVPRAEVEKELKRLGFSKVIKDL